jgi:hypothetical protein
LLIELIAKFIFVLKVNLEINSISTNLHLHVMKKLVKLLFFTMAMAITISCNLRQTGGAKIIKEQATVPFRSSHLDVLECKDTIFITQRGSGAAWEMEDLPISLMKDTTYTDDEEKISVRKAIVTDCYPGEF